VLTPVLTKRFGTDQPWKIGNYERLDGYDGLRKALTMAPDEVIAVVKDSNLRGRGGAGFPTGMKWQFIPQPKPGEPSKPHYVVINADEGEPGTCRDLPLMMNDPHSMIEGIIIACYAVRAQHAFVYIRGEAVHAIRRVTGAVQEAYAKGYLGPNVLGTDLHVDITVHAGAGAYICGEETALLDSLEGKRGQPRLKPPFPATNGLYDAPTVVNNVGTLASVPYIVLGGAAWFNAIAADTDTAWTRQWTKEQEDKHAAGEPSKKAPAPGGSPGPCMYSLSGRVKNPGQYEAPMGTTLRELIDLAGGMSRGKKLKFWTPGGSSTPLFTEAHLDTPLDFDWAVSAGSMNGTSAVMIFDEGDSVVKAVLKWTTFYEHESCGKCTPCREGTYWLAQILERFLEGEGTEEDIDTLLDTCDNILGRAFCALGDGAVSPIASSIQYFRDDYLALIKSGSTAHPTPALAGASA
jgi:NADH-quinone oxidoreductase subunit F